MHLIKILVAFFTSFPLTQLFNHCADMSKLRWAGIFVPSTLELKQFRVPVPFWGFT
jgi:hypothetical protein